MKKTTKGSLAAATAALLLLGGVGSLAYWTDDQDAPGTGITSGHLKLGAIDCGDGWLLDGETTTFVPATDLIVPGDTLTEVCTTEVDAAGQHLSASFEATGGIFDPTNALTAELTKSVTYQVGATTVDPSAPVAIADGDVITVSFEIDFDGPAATNLSNNVAGFTSALTDITVTATQAHTP